MTDTVNPKRTKTLAELLEMEYGVKVHPGPESGEYSVGITNQKILSNNPNRVGLTFCNNSANTIWLSRVPSGAVSEGIFLSANGGIVSMNWRDDMTLILNDWYAIAAGAASALSVLEIVTL